MRQHRAGALNQYLALVNRQCRAIRRFVRRDAEQPARLRLSAREKAELARGDSVAVWGPRSRVDRYVGMLARCGDPTSQLLLTALSEAKASGTFAVIAPKLDELAESHEELLAAASECADARRQFLPPDIEERHRKALLALLPYQDEVAQPEGAKEAEHSSFWSKPDSPSRWAKQFDVTVRTLNRWNKKGMIGIKKLSTKSWCIRTSDIPQS